MYVSHYSTTSLITFSFNLSLELCSKIKFLAMLDSNPFLEKLIILFVNLKICSDGADVAVTRVVIQQVGGSTYRLN